MRCCVVRGGGSGFASQRWLSAGFFRTILDAVAPTDEGVTLEVAAMDTDNVENIVTTLVREKFPNARVISVKVTEDTDFEDDTVLRVRVVFASDDEKLDAGATSGFLRHLRPKLSDIGVRAFPVMSFISHKDAGAAA
jgi:hypothetical protein